MLEDLNKLVNELNTTNSTNEKKEILKKYPQCKEMLKWVYNPYTQFWVTSKLLEKRQDLIGNEVYKDIEIMLHMLNSRQVTGHDAIKMVNAFVHANMEYKDLIYSIIDKNLKTRTDAKLINAIYPNLIPTFDCALANKYEDYAHKIDFEKEDWYASRKLDGCRNLAIPMDEMEVKCMSRQGKEFFTIDKVRDDIKKLQLGYTTVFDGEICIVDDKGNEMFDGIMSEIRKKDHQIARPKYKIFDMLLKQDFDKGESKEPLSTRLANLTLIKQRIKDLGIETLDVVEQIKIRDEEHLMEMMDNAVASGWEGLIIRKDEPYKGKRSNDLLKVKKMHDAEYVITGIETGPFRVISKDTGLEVEEVMMARVNIEHKGNVVGVGSGFSLDERREIYKNPGSVIGKTMTVKYFEESKNKDGSYSLRFPIKKIIYDGGRDV